ncbi:MAG TPA: hypothetical protein VGH67_11575 [Solirubrobacteraceae bacterium]
MLFIHAGPKSAPEALAYPLRGLSLLAAVVVGMCVPTVRGRALARGDLAAHRGLLRSMSAGIATLGVVAGVVVAISAGMAERPHQRTSAHKGEERGLLCVRHDAKDEQEHWSYRISSEEIISAVDARRPPMMHASAGLAL